MKLRSQKNTLNPREVGIELTTKCNLKCRYCYVAWREDSSCNTSPNTLGTLDFVELIDQLSNMGTTTITLAGGEPFLHKGLCTVIHAAAQRNMNLYIDTNGTMLNTISRSVMDILMAANVKLFVSLDSDQPDVYMKMTGANLNKQRTVIEGIKRAIGVGLSVSLVQVLTRENYRYEPAQYIRHAGMLGCAGVAFLKGNTQPGKLPMSDCLSPEEFLSHHQKVEKVRNQFDLIISHEYTKVCNPYFGEMGIEASGLVFACPYNTHVNFGVYKRGMDLSELIYNSDLFNKLITLSRKELNQFAMNYFSGCGALAKHSIASV